MELQLALVVGQAGLDVVGEDVEYLAGQRAVLGLGADAGVGGNIIQGAGVLHPDIGVGVMAPAARAAFTVATSS